MIRFVVIFIVVLTVSMILRSKKFKETDSVLESAGRKVEEFKVGRIHGFIDDSNKIYAQEGSNVSVNVIDLNIAKKYAFYQVKKDVNKYAVFMREDQIGVGKPLKFLSLDQVQEFYDFVKKYAPEVENIGKVNSITYK